MINTLYPNLMFTLPDLPYKYDALEPTISEQIMKLHHDAHHAKYVENLNAALKDFPDLQSKDIEELLSDIDHLPESIQKAVRNNGGGHYNHTLFWQMMTPDKTQPSASLKVAIESAFTSVDAFKEEFNKGAAAVFGSGWQWLVIDHGTLALVSTPNQDSPISQGKTVLLGLDVWEHAYYLQYLNKRPDYISAWWNVVNWDFVLERLEQAE